MSNDNRDIVYAIFGFGFGLFSFFHGFNRLRRKRLIENIPTSTVRGLAMGLVELNGKAEKTASLYSPLTETECVLFKYLIEEYRSSGKSGHWVTIASGDSFYCPFCLDDGTGRIMVFSKGAEIILPVDYEFRTGLVKTLPDKLAAFMDKNGIRYKSWLGNRTLRFKEWYIRPGEEVYVLGSASKIDNPGMDYKSVLMRRIDELKNNRQRMKEIDLDKDGRISTEEWDLAVAKLEQGLLEETLKNTPVENPLDVVISKGEEEKVFILSDHSEKSLVKKLSYESFFGIYGGAALSLATLAYLLFRFGLFK